SNLDPLIMQTDRSRQQVPQAPESEEMSSSTSPEPEPSSLQRRTEADNKFHKRLRVKRCLHPLPPSQNPPHSK
ncbi:hypothetical protein KUCAC02_004772, partial [Chaenocephalus aceratus]